MKWLMTPLLIAGSMAFAADTFKPDPKPVRCQKKVEALIRQSVKQMGYKGKFGLTMLRESAGQDIQKAPLVKYTSGAFIVDEGYLSGSGAEVIVRDESKTCEVIRLNVTTGT